MTTAATLPGPADLAELAQLLAAEDAPSELLQALDGAVLEAVRTLKELLKSEQERIRLQAARLLLDAPRKLKSLTDRAGLLRDVASLQQKAAPAAAQPPALPSASLRSGPAAPACAAPVKPRLRSPMEHRTPGLLRR